MKKSQKNHWAICLFVMISLSGCATVGREFSFQGPGELAIGQTKQSDIIKKYGRPFRVGYDSGDVQWTYAYYQYSAFSDSQTKDLVITFNKEGKVKSYVFNSSYEEDKMKIMSK